MKESPAAPRFMNKSPARLIERNERPAAPRFMNKFPARLIERNERPVATSKKQSPARLIERNERPEATSKKRTAATTEEEKEEIDVQFWIGLADEAFSLKEAKMRKRLAKNESKMREIFRSQGCDYEKIMNAKLLPRSDLM